MKTAQRIAMRAKNRNRWSHDTLTDDDADETLAWHEDHMKTWTPSPEETAATQAYLAANPDLPF